MRAVAAVFVEFAGASGKIEGVWANWKDEVEMGRAEVVGVEMGVKSVEVAGEVEVAVEVVEVVVAVVVVEVIVEVAVAVIVVEVILFEIAFVVMVEAV